MANFIEYNANYQGKRVGDCTVRAISKALNQSWQETYSGIAIQGMLMANMPSGNAVWGAYLRHKGFERYIIPDTCPDCYTVRDFCDEHPKGTYIIGTGSHAVCVVDGTIFDTWMSGDETPIYYYKKKEAD